MLQWIHYASNVYRSALLNCYILRMACQWLRGSKGGECAVLLLGSNLRFKLCAAHPRIPNCRNSGDFTVIPWEPYFAQTLYCCWKMPKKYLSITKYPWYNPAKYLVNLAEPIKQQSLMIISYHPHFKKKHISIIHLGLLLWMSLILTNNPRCIVDICHVYNDNYIIGS